MHTITASTRLSDLYVQLDIEAPEVAAAAAPGRMVWLRFPGADRATPHSIADVDEKKGTVTVVIDMNHADTAGAGEVVSGTTLEVTGPFGQAADTQAFGKVLCVAEGPGVAALLPRLRAYKEKDSYTIAVLAYPSKDMIYWRERLDPFCDELYVVTDDGTFGIKGPTKHTLKAVCDHNQDIERVLAIGPLKSLKSCADTTRTYEIPTAISLVAAYEEARPDRTEEHGGRSQTMFDWTNVRDIDGHQADFDELARQMGFQITV
jgi:ferredoxin--NADP+ reductase